MILTPKQEQGLKLAVKRYKDNEPYTVIAGYAGVGKSTLIRFIIAALDLDPEFIAYCAYTGKAAQVLRNKGCHNAMTAHRLLYRSVPKDDGTFIHIPKETLAPFKLIIVDEVSMLPKRMWEQLLKYRVHVIALGDPGQLPPVAAENNGALEHPHIFLDEIMRQAAESEIIRLTLDIREGRGLKLQRGQEVRVVERTEILQSRFFHWADQILVGKNNTRAQVNAQMRRDIWGEDLPEPCPQDRIICLHNDWETISPSGDPLVNGMTGFLDSIVYDNSNPWQEKTPWICFTPDYEGAGQFQRLEIDYKLITTREPLVTRGANGTWRDIPRRFQPHEFDYGYAITTHKAQGSEFDKVIVLEEFLKSESRQDHIRWLYTAATRAAKKLIIVRNYRPL